MLGFCSPLALRTSRACGATQPSICKNGSRQLRASASESEPQHSKNLFGAVAAATTVLMGAFALPILAEPTGFFDRLKRVGAPAETELSTPKKGRRESTSFVTKAVKSVGAAVVRIDTERVMRGPAGIILQPGDDGAFFDDNTLKKFFGEYYNKQRGQGGGGGNGTNSPVPFNEPRRLMRGQGSGFITSKDGVVITNAHVVKGAEKVTVTLTDGRTFEGVVKGTDELLDLAVVKIDAAGKELPVAPLGVSADLQVGDWVIAVGNPVGLDNTVTVGIVSSLNRTCAEVGIPDKRMSLIQTSTPLNIGNSGGPLLNEFGEVVGINTAVRMNAEAIGFAIPIDRARTVAKELEKGKAIAHAYVGIQMVNMTARMAEENNSDPNASVVIPEVEGACIMRVMPSSPAATGGLRRYDIIVAIDGRTVRNVKEAQSIVDSFVVGQTVSMKVVRGHSGNVIELNVKTGDFAAAVNASRDSTTTILPVPVPGH